MKSKTKIEKQLIRKQNPDVVETVVAAKKNNKWVEVAAILSGSRRQRMNINLRDIEDLVEKNQNIVVPGKVLSSGEVNKKIRITALSFSDKAKEKLKNKGIEFNTIIEEIKKNPDAKGIKIIGVRE